MVHSAILVLEMPDRSDPEKANAWTAVLCTVAKLTSENKTIQRLGETVLLLPLRSAFSALSTLVTVAQLNSISYRVLFLDQDSEWICS